MPRGPRTSPETKAAVRADLEAQVPVDEIAETHGLAVSSVRGYASKWKIKCSSTPKPRKPRAKKKTKPKKTDKTKVTAVSRSRGSARRPVAQTLDDLTPLAREHLVKGAENILVLIGDPKSLSSPRSYLNLLKSLSEMGAICPPLLARVALVEDVEEVLTPEARDAAVDAIPPGVLRASLARRQVH